MDNSISVNGGLFFDLNEQGLIRTDCDRGVERDDANTYVGGNRVSIQSNGKFVLIAEDYREREFVEDEFTIFQGQDNGRVCFESFWRKISGSPMGFGFLSSFER